MANHSDEKIKETLDAYDKEQQEFENHWLWQELQTTPQEFFKSVREYVKQSGIDEHMWQQKLAEAKQALETQVAEQEKNYKRVKLVSSGLKL